MIVQICIVNSSPDIFSIWSVKQVICTVWLTLIQTYHSPFQLQLKNLNIVNNK